MSKRYRVSLVDYDEDLFAPQGWEGDFLGASGADWVVGQHRTPETAMAAAKGADVVLVQSVRKLLTKEVIEQLEGCRGIIRVGIGFDSVDEAACNEHGISLCNVPEYCVQEVAEHALALLLAAARNLVRQDDWLRAGKWDRTGAKPGRRLAGQTLGLVGFGRVARSLAEKTRGMEWKLLTYDPYISDEMAQRYGAEKVSMEELMSRSDLISVQSPLNAETFHLVGEREFAVVKPGAIIVNTSRGPVVDEAALVAALRSGRVWAAGLDVFEQEPLTADNPLLSMDNVVLTPHVAGYSEEAVGDLYRSACRTAISLISGVWPSTGVNPAARPLWESKWAAR